MGVLNVTPDSFSDGGRFYNLEDAVAHGREMVGDGADFVDVGGESTRPGSDPISEEEEKKRVVPVIERLVKETTVPISIDTYKAAVADAGLHAGATIVNDISGLKFDPEMLRVVVRHKATLVVMHVKGTPKTMQENPVYDDVVGEIGEFLRRQAEKAAEAGVEQVIIDPGIGFGKRLGELKGLGYPLLAGPSRKSFIGKLLNLPADQRLEGTAAAVTACILNGADIVRVHDVKEMRRVVTIADAVKRSVGASRDSASHSGL